MPESINVNTSTTPSAPTTPNNMPGAAQAATPADQTDPAPAAGTSADLSADDAAELARLRELHRDEQKYRREATTNHRDAEAYRNLLGALGVNGKEAKEFDPQAAITDLNNRLETERTARIRAEVARTEQVDPEDFTGDTEEEMRASAQRFKERLAARVEAEVAKRAAGPGSAAAPAGEVTANGKVTGEKQITTRDQLSAMSAKQIVEAREKGQLDDLLAGKTT